MDVDGSADVLPLRSLVSDACCAKGLLIALPLFYTASTSHDVNLAVPTLYPLEVLNTRLVSIFECSNSKEKPSNDLMLLQCGRALS